MNKKSANKQSTKHARHQLKPVYAAVLLACAVQTAQANPAGGSVVNGSASFATSGNTLTVTNTPGTIINWKSFSIGSREITNFAQQSASSAVLNRVISNDPSNILGTLRSNGRVFLVNPNGIVFGAGSTVNVAGLVASTLNLSDADFLAGRNNFTEVPGAGNISNAGNIKARKGGQIFLIAPDVKNTGVIAAPNGEILLAAGYSVELVDTDDPSLRVSITAPAGDATNVGKLIASSGSLGLFGAVVRNSGTVSADSATMQGGKIVFKATQSVEAGGTISARGAGGGTINLLADMQSGTVNVTGKLDASAPVRGNGGFIETSAAHVQVEDTAYVTTAAPNGNSGTWLIDPNDFTIAAAGGDITGATLSTALDTTNVLIQSTAGGVVGNGDIFVNDNIAKTATTIATTTLTLQAQNSIIVAPVVGISSTGGALNVVFNADSDGLNGGAISMGTGSSITSKGGNVIFGGGIAGNGTGNAVGTALNVSGIELLGASISTGIGSITLNGQGYGAGGSNMGVYLHSGASLTTTSGMITVNGKGGAGTNLNYGVWLTDTGTSISSVHGNISITGTGAGSAGSNDGIRIDAGATVISTGTAAITLNGTGSSTGTDFNYGVLLSDAGTLVQSANGNISVTGQGAGTGTDNYGVHVRSGAVVNSTGAAAITLNGTGGAGTDGNYGVWLTGTGTTVSSVYGGISITGTGAGSATSNDGVRIDLGAAVTSWYASIDLNGTGSAGTDYNYGVLLADAGTLVQSQYGNISITGQGQGTGLFDYGILLRDAASVTSTYSANISFSGMGAGSAEGIYTSTATTPTTIGGAGYAGNITLASAGNITLTDALNAGAGTVTLRADSLGTCAIPANCGAVNFSGSGHITAGTTNIYYDPVSYSDAATKSDTSGDPYTAYITGTYTAWMLVNDATQLQAMNTNLAGTYALGGDVDATVTATLNSDGSGGYYGFAPVGISGTPYTGRFDGLNHTIGNLYINRPAENDVGLFGVIGAGGTVSNVGLVTSNITGGFNTGGLAGSNLGGINNSYAMGVTVSGISGVGGLVGVNSNSIFNSYVSGGTVTGSGWAVGGLAGVNDGGNIDSSNVIATTVIGTDYVGGLVGLNHGGNGGNGGAAVTSSSGSAGIAGSNAVISNSYVSGGSVSGANNVGGLVGQNIGGTGGNGGIGFSGWLGGIGGAGGAATISSSYADGGTVTGTGNNVGGLAGNNVLGASGTFGADTLYAGAGGAGGAASIGYSFVSSGSVLGVTNVGGLVGYNNYGDISYSNVDIVTVNGSGGSIGGLVGYNNGFTSSGISVAGNISGSYVNNGTVIGGSLATEVGGLVGTNNYGDISYSHVNNGTVTGATNVGGLVGRNNSGSWFHNASPTNYYTYYGTISNSYVNNGSVTGTTSVGGLAGWANGFGSINNSHVTHSYINSASVTPSTDVGGLVGFNNYTDISNSYVDTTSVGSSSALNVGGLVGRNNGSISTSSFSNGYVSGGALTGTSYGVGGLAGVNHGAISNSFVSGGTVSGVGNVGGLAGYNDDYISDSHVSDSTVSGLYAVGGLVGNNRSLDGPNYGGHIINSYVENGTVSGNSSVGGLVGDNSATINFSYVNGGTVTGTSSAIGGLVGWNSGNINYSYVNGASVTGTNNVGGLVGGNYNFGDISYSHVNGTSVKGVWNVGGLVGYNYGYTYLGVVNGGSINNSYVSGGTVTGGSQVGGLVGYNAGKINSSYVNGGTVTGTGSASAIGGLVGYNRGTIYNSYIDGGTVTGNNNVGGLVGYNLAVNTGSASPDWGYIGGSISNSYVTNGTISGNNNVGGLVGYNYGNINYTYVNGGSVNGLASGSAIGGLVGNNSVGLISNSYANTGVVGGASTNVGALVGYDNGVIGYSFWDSDTSALPGIGFDTGSWWFNGSAPYGLTTADMMNQATLATAGFNFTPGNNTWFMIDGNTRPFLQSEYSTTITNAHQLQMMAMNLGASYTLANNLDLASALDNTTITGMWGIAGFVPVGDSITPFIGQLNGQQHTISNLTINSAGGDAGLFGVVGLTGVVSNVGLIGSSVVASGSSVGGLAGYNAGTISNSYVSNGSVYTPGAYGSVGGLVGYNAGTISNSYVSGGSVTGQYYDVGGLAGTNSGIISDSYVIGTSVAITGTGAAWGSVGGLVGYNIGSISNSYASNGSVSGGVIGGVVGYNSGTVSNTFWDVAGGAVNGIGWDATLATPGPNDIGAAGLTTAQMMTQGSFTGFDFNSGTPIWFMIDGNTRPFLQSEWSTTITNAHQLQLMTLNLGASYTLGANIDMAETSSSTGMWSNAGFVPVGYVTYTNPFYGQFDGQGHTISNLTINRPGYSEIGLFGDISNTGVVSNVTLLNPVVTGYWSVGALAGNNSGMIGNSHVSGGTVGGYSEVGGLVGNNYGNISNSYVSSGTVSGNSRVGGLVGYNHGIIGNSHADSTAVTGSYNVGGLVGYNNSGGSNTSGYVWGGRINNSYVSGGTVNGGASSSGSMVGGLVGSNHGFVSNSYVSSGSVTGASSLGGLIGYDSGEGAVSNSHYNVSAVTINGANQVTLYGLYNDVLNINSVGQYDDWFNGGLLTPLNIANYSASLVAAGANSYTISDMHGMKDLLGFSDYAGYTFTLANNISLDAGYYIPDLAANFDGANFTLSSLNIDQPFNPRLGLFGMISFGSTVSNVRLLNPIMSGLWDVAGLAGWSGGSIVNSHVIGGTVIGLGSDVGGLVGGNSGSISSSDVSGGSVTGTYNAGGLAGSNDIYGSISGSHVSNVIVAGNSDVGGLAGYNSYGTISGSYVSGGSVTGSWFVGGLVGYSYYGSIDSSNATASVNGDYYVGGLAGRMYSGTINFSHATGVVTGTGNYVGGLAGSAEWQFGIYDSYATGNVTSLTGNYVGGLVGNANSASDTIARSYATGDVTGASYVGGLVGYNWDVNIDSSFATGNVTGTGNDVGGLVGHNGGSSSYAGGSISNSYASGNVSGSNNVGGLVGYNGTAGIGVTGAGSTAIITPWGGRISNSYSSSGSVISSVTDGSGNVGGVVGYNSGSISNSYASNGSVSGIGAWYIGGLVGNNDFYGGIVNSFWNSETTGLTNAVGSGSGAVTNGTRLTSAGMKTMASFTRAGWDIANTGGAGKIWRIYEGSTNPLLTSFLTPLSVTANAASKTYDGLAFSGGSGVTYSIASPTLSGTLAYSGTSQGAINAGGYLITPGGYYSIQQGYDISYVNGTLTINAAPVTLPGLSLNANNASKTYGDLLTFSGAAFTPVGLLGSDTISGVTLTSAGAVATANVGAYAIVITPGSEVFSVGSASNYIITYVDGTLTVTARPIDITAIAASKVYGDADPALTFNVGGSGLASGDTNATVFSGSLSRVAGEDVATGPYAITIGSLATNANYTATFVPGASLTITPATLTVKANDANKVLSTADPLLTYMVSGLKLSDTEAAVLSGSLSRVHGEAVGWYLITHGSLAANSNYTMKYLPGTFTILAPTVINEIVDISVQDDDEKKRWLEEIVVADAGGDTGTQSLPMCK
jgi:filamentous hemagglutinin family protein